MRNIAEQTLNNLFEKYVDYDSDLNGLELIIRHKAGVFQLNYHGVTNQIWLSSPVSGAHHFILKNNNWLSTRDDSIHLFDVLDQEIK